MTNELIVQSNGNQISIAPFSGSDSFDLAIRMAKVLDQSDFLPENFKGKPGNTLIAFELANRLKIPVSLVLQNCNIIYGKPSFSAKTQIALINQSGKYDSPLMFEFNEDKTTCFAWAEFRGKRIEGPKVSLDMAKAEGWYGKRGSKWQAMPEVMLMYRSATFFANIHAPELIMGIPSTEELYDTEGKTREAVTIEKAMHSVDEHSHKPKNIPNLANIAVEEPENTESSPEKEPGTPKAENKKPELKTEGFS